MDEDDYSDYLKHLSNLIHVMSLCSGFLFTAYTVLITRLPDPGSITAQLTLLVISIYLSICLYCLGYFLNAVLHCCRNFPPMTKTTAITNLLFLFVSTTAMSIATTLMSFLWNLTYLAVVQTVQWIFYLVITCLFVIKPAWTYRKAKSSEIAIRTS
jgi:drug/metabolite transporter (DMT)-like permease